MSSATTDRMKALLRKVLDRARLPADLRQEIVAALARKRGQGRPRQIDPASVRAMRQSGLSAQDIATQLGVTRAAVYKALQADK